MKHKVRSTKPVDAIRVAALLAPQKSDLPWPAWVDAALKAKTLTINGTACVTLLGNMDAHDDDAIVQLPDGVIVILSAEAFTAIYEPVPSK